MSYQFDTRQLRAQSQVKIERQVAPARLLARRTARQLRREQRAF